MKRYLPAVLLAFAMLCLTGCGMLLAREIYEESPHVEHLVEDLDTDDLVATSESSLKNALILMTRAGMTEGMIQLVGYQGDPNRDLLNAVEEISNNEPIGKYAVYYMTYGLTKVLSNYHAAISIKYRRTPEQIASIIQTSGSSGFKNCIRQSMSGFEPVLTVELPYFDETTYDPHALIKELYYEYPALALGYPEITVGLYPDSGLRRIVEIEMKYPHTRSVMLTRASMVRTASEAMLDSVESGMSGARLALELRDMIADSVSFDYDAAAEAEFIGQPGTGDAWTIYGALVLGRATGEGYALAFKRFCDMESVPCRIVSGQYLGEEHVWNIVQIGGNWYHIDVAADDIDGSYNWFLKNDVDMSLDHSWDSSDFACSADSIPVETLRPEGPDADGADNGEAQVA